VYLGIVVLLTRSPISGGEGEPNMLAAKFVLAAAIVNLIVLFTALAVNVSLASFG
jgi:hypothetical protein